VEYYRSKTMHQYYRDTYSVRFSLSDIGNLSRQDVLKFMLSRSQDICSLYKNILSMDSGLAPDHDKGLKYLLLAIAMSNLALDTAWEGKQTVLPEDYRASIKNCIIESLTHYSHLEYLEIAIQLFFRIGDIESVVLLVNQNSEHLAESPNIIKIMLMIASIEENYDVAFSLVQKLTANPALMGDDPLGMLMAVSVIYKCGGIPENYIDFRSLFNTRMPAPMDSYTTHIAPGKINKKTTVVICCDPDYYSLHAVHLLRSIYHTNRDELNVHFHIYNMNDTLMADIQRNVDSFPELHISCTSETVVEDSHKKTAYACKRFIFAQTALQMLETPVLIVDADSLLRKPWHEVQKSIGDKDLLVNRPEVSPFWESIIGGFVWLGGGEQSTRYISQVSLFLRSNFAQDNYRWYIDQVALSAVMCEMEKYQPVYSIPTDYAFDIRHSDHSFAWAITTVKSGQSKYSAYRDFLAAQYPF